MRQVSDKFTLDLLVKPGRGRPRKIDAKSAAQRQREYRQRQKARFAIPVTPLRKIPVTMVASLAPKDQIKTFTLAYPEFCLLIDVVARLANSRSDTSGEWNRLYNHLVGEK